MAFAGLYAFWKDNSLGGDAPWLSSCTIITTDAGPDIGQIHNRQPVILDQSTWDLWLDPQFSDREELEGLLLPLPAGTLVKYPVGREVGKSSVDGPELIEAIA